MKLIMLWKSFTNDESGAVTVDWVVLTAALVGLGLAVIIAIRPGIETAADRIYDETKKGGTTEIAITVSD